MDGAFDLDLAADQGVNLTVPGALDQVGGESLERVFGRPGIVLVVHPLGLWLGGRLVVLVVGLDLGDAVRDVVQHVQAADALLLQKVHGVAVFFPEQRDQKVAPLDQVFAAGLDVHGRPLQDPLKARGLLRVDVALFGQSLDVVLEELHQILLQLFDLAATVAQDFGHILVKRQGVQHVLETQKLVATLPGFLDRQGQGNFKFPTNLHSPLLPRAWPGKLCSLRSSWWAAAGSGFFHTTFQGKLVLLGQ